MNVLSPVILDVIEVDAVILAGRRNEGEREGELTTALSGSKAIAWYERLLCELGRTTTFFHGKWEYCKAKPDEGEACRKVQW